MPNLGGKSRAQSQGEGTGTVTGAPNLDQQGLSISVSKGQSNLTQANTGGIVFTLVSVTGTFS
jgi:hypothetical protein